MLQIENNQKKLNTFYADVDKLGLKFPVAMIAEATGYKKGTVSSYLNKKIEPSDAFIDAFYKKYQNSLNFPQLNTGVPENVIDRSSLERSIENLTQNELRTTAIIEKLVALLELQHSKGPTLAPPGTSGTETLNPRKKINR